MERQLEESPIIENSSERSRMDILKTSADFNPSLPPLDLRNGHRERLANKVLQQFLLDDAELAKVIETMRSEMEKGLSSTEQRRTDSSLLMEDTYVRQLLNGNENGNFLALDLGGTNFRVLSIIMSSGRCTSSYTRNYNVPDALLRGPSKAVFDHIAASIADFVQSQNDNTELTEKMPLGFCFSFPMKQKAMNSAVLSTWTKSYKCSDGVGQDPVRMLEEAIKRQKHLNVEVVSILNDTTGTLMAGSYLDSNCRIGMIMGTGFNVAYVESANRAEKLLDTKIELSDIVLIDTESGAFGDNGCLNFVKTKYDQTVDSNSNHVGSFTFEKLFAGHYIGDLVRLLLLDLHQLGAFGAGANVSILEEWGRVRAEDVTRVCSGIDNTEQVLRELGVPAGSDDNDDIRLLRYVCDVVSWRAAGLVAAVVTAVLRHTERVGRTTVAVDGTLFELHPYLHTVMTNITARLGQDADVKYILAKDGSGIGAAFVASVTERIKTQGNCTSNDPDFVYAGPTEL